MFELLSWCCPDHKGEGHPGQIALDCIDYHFLSGVSKTAGVDCVWTARLMLPDQEGKVTLGRSNWTAEANLFQLSESMLQVLTVSGLLT